MAGNNEANKESVAIKKVVVQIGKKELILDISDARELRDVLNDLFGKVVTEEHHHHHTPTYPYWSYRGPAWTLNSGSSFQYKDNAVYCSTGNINPAYDPKQPELLKVEVTG